MNITRDSKSGRLFVEGQPALVSYIRGDYINRKRGEIEYYPGPVGVVVAWPDKDGQIHFGFSKVNLRMGDHFDKKVGINMAVGRSLFKNDIQYPFDNFRPIIRDALLRMFYRAQNYYKYLTTPDEFQKGSVNNL